MNSEIRVLIAAQAGWLRHELVEDAAMSKPVFHKLKKKPHVCVLDHCQREPLRQVLSDANKVLLQGRKPQREVSVA